MTVRNLLSTVDLECMSDSGGQLRLLFTKEDGTTDEFYLSSDVQEDLRHDTIDELEYLLETEVARWNVDYNVVDEGYTLAISI